MTAVSQNFSLYAGDTKNLIVTVTQENGSPLDLTGSIVKWAARKEYANVNVILKQAQDVTVSGSTVTIKLVPSDTEALLGSYYHECELQDALGNKSTIFVGTMNVNKSTI